jgi:hypothetical protein
MTSQTLQAEGLRLYRERVESILPEDVRGQTWHAKSGWLRNCASQGPIRDVFVQLMKDLGPISQAEDGTPEGQLGDEIRDVSDILWYAMDEKTREHAEALVAALDGEGSG